MAQHGALATLKDLAEKEVDDAAVLLGEMRRGCQQAEEQLKMLIDYQQHEYRNNLNSDMGQGITSNRWINYQQFIQTLEKAIEQHRQQLNQWTQSRPGIEQLARQKTTFTGLADSAGQTNLGGVTGRKSPGSKKMDEFAQRAAMRKPE